MCVWAVRVHVHECNTHTLSINRVDLGFELPRCCMRACCGRILVDYYRTRHVDKPINISSPHFPFDRQLTPKEARVGDHVGAPELLQILRLGGIVASLVIAR